MADQKLFWNNASSRYDASVEKKYAATYARTLELAGQYLRKDMVALDFACGTGITTVALAGSVAKIDAIDIADRMVEVAEEKARERGITNTRFMVTYLHDPRLMPRTYDAVMAFNVLLFCEDPSGVLLRIRELLKPGGVLLSTTDCYAENGAIVRLLASALMRLGLMPPMALFTCASLEGAIREAGFTPLAAERLYPFPVNQFIAART